MRVVFIGPPGAGKGTQAIRLSQKLGVTHLSTGDVLREARRMGTSLGKQAGAYTDHGRLVPDAIVVRLVADRLTGADCKRGYLFDGFPRTLPQAESLDALLARRALPLDLAVEFIAPDDELLRRLSKRGRSDDQEATIRQRLRGYATLTRPIVDYYEKIGILHRVDAVGAVDQVFARLWAAVEQVRK
jgi:adenylate kinase